MKKFLVLCIICITLLLSGCAQRSEPENSNNANNDIENPPLSSTSTSIVVYFSWSSSHNTQTMAEYIAEAVNADQFRIAPKTPYTTNYNDVIRVAQEEKNRKARPELNEDIAKEDFNRYDVVFLGYPIWWNDAPMIIYTFLEAHDFTGKSIIPFATSGGSGIQEEDRFGEITKAKVLDGYCISGFRTSDSTKNRVVEWVNSLGLASEEETENRIMKMMVADQELTVELVDNSATRDLIQRLSISPMVLIFEDYAGSEKIAYPTPALDLSDTEGYDPKVGDLMIYTPWNNLCAFYIDSAGYSESLVLVGHIQNNGIEILLSQTGEFSVTLFL